MCFQIMDYKNCLVSTIKPCSEAYCRLPNWIHTLTPHHNVNKAAWPLPQKFSNKFISLNIWLIYENYYIHI